MSIRPKYNPTMNAAERRHQERVRQEPCFGCGAFQTVAHHLLAMFPGKRWRRDHQALLPVCDICHRAIHDRFGTESLWLNHMGKSWGAMIDKVKTLWSRSQEAERG